MGANSFITRGQGKTAKEAFRAAVDAARWEDGNGGYTGTIAEKSQFVQITVPAGVEPYAFAKSLLDKRIDDKWGPAGCLANSPGEWIFVGWAAS